MNDEIVNRLNAKFPKKLVKRRDIGGGDGKRAVDYIAGSVVIRRLNEVFGSEWNFEVVDRIVDLQEGQIAILGRLTVPTYLIENRMITTHSDVLSGTDTKSVHDQTERHEGAKTPQSIIKEQWGGATIERYRSNNKIVDLGNNLKAAATDSLKKCASLLGVALYLYDTDEVVATFEPTVEIAEVDKELKPATKIQLTAIEKVLNVKKVPLETLLTEFKVKSLEELDSNTAAQIITLKHPFWEKK